MVQSDNKDILDGHEDTIGVYHHVPQPYNEDVYVHSTKPISYIYFWKEAPGAEETGRW